MAYYSRKSRFGGEKCDYLIFDDFSLLWHMKKWGSGSICHDPKKFEIKHQQVTTSREQLFGAIPEV